MIFGRKILTKTFGQVREDNRWLIRKIAERDKVYMDANVVTFTRPQYRRWKSDARNTKKVFQNNLHQKRPEERSKSGRKDDVENDVRQMGIVNWRQVVQDEDGWRRATGEGLIFLR